MTLSALIDRCVKAKRVNDAERLFAKLKAAKKAAKAESSTTSTTTSIPEIAMSSAQKKKALGSKMMEPNVITFNSLINGYAKKGSLKMALQTFEEMKLANVAVDERTFNILLNACAKRGDAAKMLAIFEEMKSKGFKPDAIACSQLIRTCSGNVKRTEHEYDVDDNNSNNINDNNNNENVTMQSRNKGVQQDVGKLWDLMLEIGGEGGGVAQPSVATYNAAIAGYVKQGMLDKALEKLQEMKERKQRMVDDGEKKKKNSGSGGDVAPSVVTYTILVDGFGRAGDLDKAVELFKDMKKQGIEPDTTIYRYV